MPEYQNPLKKEKSPRLISQKYPIPTTVGAIYDLTLRTISLVIKKTRKNLEKLL